MPRGMTAADVLKYEKNELGNMLKIVDGIDPSSISSNNLMWLAETKSAAKPYGKVESISGHFRVIARDDQGGVLVEKVEGEKQ